MKKINKNTITPMALAISVACLTVTAADNSSLSPKASAKSTTTSYDNQHSHGLIIKHKSTGTLAKSQQMASEHAIQKLSSQLGAQAKHQGFNALGSQIIGFKNKQTNRSLTQMAKKLMATGKYEYVDLNLNMQPTLTPNDPRLNEMWGLVESTAGINAKTAWDDNRGSGVTVAVLDTGYRPHHDLAANIIGGYDFVSSAARARDGNGRDSNAQDQGDWSTGISCQASNSSWHGTHVAGTIAAVGNNATGVVGVAYQSKVVPVRVLAECGGTVSDIADAIIWASGGSVSGVPANPNPAKIINLSLGGFGSCPTTYQSAINTARANGSVVVVAAGNSNSNVSNFTPANCSGVISVASLNRSASRSSFSNFGSLIDVAAPGGGSGGNILSTLNTGATIPASDSYALYAGTSMAAPHVSGVAALMLAKDSSLTPTAIESTIKSSARSFPPGSNCSTSNCGDGILDAAAAVAAVGGTPPPPPPPTNLAVPQNFSMGFAQCYGIVQYNWDAVQGATHYKINQRHISATNSVYVGQVSATTVVMAAPGPGYRYKIQACNASSCGNFTSELIAPFRTARCN